MIHIKMDENYTSVIYYYGTYTGKKSPYAFKVRVVYESLDAGNGKTVAENSTVEKVIFDDNEEWIQRWEPDIPLKKVKKRIKDFTKKWLFDKPEDDNE